MNLPEVVKALLRAYAAKFPVPQSEPGEAHEENCRQWSIRFAEQCTFSFPDAAYGMKRAGEGRPISKDTLSQNKMGLVCWDLLIGTGTGRPVLADEPAFHDIHDQIFVEVSPVNHLGAQPTPVPNPGTPVPNPGTPVVCKAVEASAEVLDALHELRLEMADAHRLALKFYEQAEVALRRLEAQHHEPRKVSLSNRYIGKVEGTVSGATK